MGTLTHYKHYAIHYTYSEIDFHLNYTHDVNNS
jgi:hypothetical protein